MSTPAALYDSIIAGMSVPSYTVDGISAPEARMAGSITSSRNFGDDQSARETWAWLSMIIGS